MGDLATDPEAVVRAFLADLERLDAEAAVSRLADDATYRNVPFPPARGRPAIAAQLRWMGRTFRAFEVRYHNVAVNGTTVLTERNDVITVGPVAADFWVCGTFEVVDGRITVWRDRFDFVDLAVAFAKGAVRAGLAALRR